MFPLPAPKAPSRETGGAFAAAGIKGEQVVTGNQAAFAGGADHLCRTPTHPENPSR